MMSRFSALAAMAALACGCAKTPTAPVVPPAVAVPGQACEVELGGRVQEVVTGNRAITVYVSPDDCSQPTARTITRAMAKGDGEFFAEVWVPCDTTLTVCASVEPRAPLDGVPKPTRHWGKLDRALVAKGQGEIEFFGLSWPMKDQADERTFAAPQPMLLPPVGHQVRR